MQKFHGGIRITDAEISAIEDYLFGTGIRPPLTDDGVLKTVDYLKRICERNELKNIQDIRRYYYVIRKKCIGFFDNAHKAKNN